MFFSIFEVRKQDFSNLLRISILSNLGHSGFFSELFGIRMWSIINLVEKFRVNYVVVFPTVFQILINVSVEI